MNELAVFENHQIRRIYDDVMQTWLFSVVDIVRVLTHSPDTGAYWRKLKQRLNQEESEVVTNYHELKMKAADGKVYRTDAASVETILRLVHFIAKKARLELETTTRQKVISVDSFLPHHDN